MPFRKSTEDWQDRIWYGGQFAGCNNHSNISSYWKTTFKTWNISHSLWASEWITVNWVTISILKLFKTVLIFPSLDGRQIGGVFYLNWLTSSCVFPHESKAFQMIVVVGWEFIQAKVTRLKILSFCTCKMPGILFHFSTSVMVFNCEQYNTLTGQAMVTSRVQASLYKAQWKILNHFNHKKTAEAKVDSYKCSVIL